jgi:hypothetical protein
MLATKLVDSWEPIRVLNIGIVSTLVGATLVTGMIFLEVLTPNRLGGAYCLIAFGIGPIFAVSPSKALASVKKSAGSAAAVFGSLEIGLSGILATLVSVYHDDTPLPFGIIVGLIAVTGGLLGWLANHWEKQAKFENTDP